MQSVVFGITGGSGAPIAKKILGELLKNESICVSLLVSRYARDVFKYESQMNLGSSLDDLKIAIEREYGINDRLQIFDETDMAAPISSGSNRSSCMIIAPCSMSTLATIAHGMTMNLIHRAASVALKEKRKLILVPRESPLSTIHLKNMLELSQCGAHIVPATTAFYYQPQTAEDMIDFVCMKVLDLAGITHQIDKRWKGQAAIQYESD